MGVDLTEPFSTRQETTQRSWPKCFHCSKALGKLYPVEVFGIVGRERPTALNQRFRILVEVECHDMVQRLVVESLTWHGTANDFDKLGDTFAFVRGDKGRWTTAPVGPEWRRKRKALALWKPGDSR